jgi:hypothetical protein
MNGEEGSVEEELGFVGMFYSIMTASNLLERRRRVLRAKEERAEVARQLLADFDALRRKERVQEMTFVFVDKSRLTVSALEGGEVRFRWESEGSAFEVVTKAGEPIRPLDDETISVLLEHAHMEVVSVDY